jgi:two-component system response regulator LytT
MSKIKVLIIEDELQAQQLLKDMLSELDYNFEIVNCLNSVKSSVEWFKNNPHPELVLLDIQLSDGISFSIFENISIESMIIFTTSYDEYAIQAFKVNSLDYLLKPIDKDELNNAIDKFFCYGKRFIRKKNFEIDYNEIASIIKKNKSQYRKRFLIQTNEDFLQLPVEEIAYFFSLQKITFAVTFNKKKYPLNFSLENLKEQLDPEKFFKVNRQIIININAIEKINSYFQGKLVINTIPEHSEKIIIGKDKAASFKRWLDR